MRHAFVGLVGRQGLETLLPENRATCRWSLDAVRLKPRACLWAVLEPENAAQVLDLLADGESLAALWFLSQAADTLGPVAPSRAESGA